MRISDWSSDVCSSDLLCASLRYFLQIDETAGALDDVRIDEAQHIRRVAQFVGIDQTRCGEKVANAFERNRRNRLIERQLAHARRNVLDRKSTRLNSSH